MVTRVAKTPAFPFYGKDAYDDEAFSQLSFAEQGVYLYLAWWQWQEGTIPASLDDILDKVPRRKIAEAKRVWPEIQRWFPPCGPDADRRQNAQVEERRRKAVGDRDKNRQGAEITNAKRWGNRSLSDSVSESQSDTDSESLRAASANASADKPKVSGEEPGVQGGAPDFEIVARVVAKLDGCALKVHPPDQIAVAWVNEYGEALIVETLVDCETDYAGKHWRYLEQILTNRRDNPNARPGSRRRGTGNRRTETRTGAGGAAATPREERGDDGLNVRPYVPRGSTSGST